MLPPSARNPTGVTTSQGRDRVAVSGRQGSQFGCFSAQPYVRHCRERTRLYQPIEEYNPALNMHLAAHDAALRAYIEQEFEAYLKCGRLERGFLHISCDSCHGEHLMFLVPKPRVNLTRFHGVFASNCKYRTRVTPVKWGVGWSARHQGESGGADAGRTSRIDESGATAETSLWNRYRDLPGLRRGSAGHCLH